MKKLKKESLKPCDEAWSLISNHYLLGCLTSSIYRTKISNNELGLNELSSKDFGKLIIFNNCSLNFIINKDLKLSKEEWFFIYAVVLIFLGWGLDKKLEKDKDIIKERIYFLFCIYYVYEALDITDIPDNWKMYFKYKEIFSFKNESSLYEQILNNEDYISDLVTFSLNKTENSCIVFKNEKYQYGWKKPFNEIFTENLVSQAQKTIAIRANKEYSEDEIKKRDSLSHKAQRWFITHYPLLSSLASSFKIIEDIKYCQKYDIKIAAVSVVEKTIFINPLANLTEQGMRFVIAHEILHVALNHHSRKQGRNHLTWNLACDFVINHWLVSMNVGIPPASIFLDSSLAGKSADEIYIMINNDIRLRRKLGTLRNLEAGQAKNSAGDMLEEDVRYFSDFEDACKESLLRGVFLHESFGKGDLPADLVEEIKSINQPAIPWQVELARWIAQQFPLEESKKTYSRASRRQSATPDIPRPRYIRPNEDKITRTLGVLLDTSGSMDKELLGKCLGAISSYSAAQEIKYIRLIFCDAQPYDEGYVPIELLSTKIKVKGRGGTVLQQAVNYLQIAKDFPTEAPILILTDGFIEQDLEVQRKHAFLVPNKRNLPFIPKGEVFEFK